MALRERALPGRSDLLHLLLRPAGQRDAALPGSADAGSRDGVQHHDQREDNTMSTMYECQQCHGTFESDWTTKDALTEMGELFPEFRGGNVLVVCDDCHKEIMERRESGWP